APGVVTQGFERENSLLQRTAFKLPTGNILRTRGFAFRSHLARPLDGALDVGHVLERFAKLLLLLDTMRTPVEAIHLCLFGCEAFGKSIVAVIVVIPARSIGRRKQDHNAGPEKRLPRSWLGCAR